VYNRRATGRFKEPEKKQKKIGEERARSPEEQPEADARRLTPRLSARVRGKCRNSAGNEKVQKASERWGGQFDLLTVFP